MPIYDEQYTYYAPTLPGICCHALSRRLPWSLGPPLEEEEEEEEEVSVKTSHNQNPSPFPLMIEVTVDDADEEAEVDDLA